MSKKEWTPYPFAGDDCWVLSFHNLTYECLVYQCRLGYMAHVHGSLPDATGGVLWKMSYPTKEEAQAAAEQKLLELLKEDRQHIDAAIHEFEASTAPVEQLRRALEVISLCEYHYSCECVNVADRALAELTKDPSGL